MTVPKICRLAWRVDDIEDFSARMNDLLGIGFVVPSLIAELYPDAGFKVLFGEHGMEPIQPAPEGLGFGGEGTLIEIAIDVADAEAVRADLATARYVPTAISYLPVPAVNEYLFGRDFHGVPFLACTAGVNEAQLRSQGPFAALEHANPPKIGRISVVADDIDALAADLGRFYAMRFIEVDADGLGRRALGGTHRLRLIEGPSALLDGIERPLAAVDILHDDVEAARARFEAAGHMVRHRAALASGGTGYFFGETVHGLPIALYPVSADAGLGARFEAPAAREPA